MNIFEADPSIADINLNLSLGCQLRCLGRRYHTTVDDAVKHVV